MTATRHGAAVRLGRRERERTPREPATKAVAGRHGSCRMSQGGQPLLALMRWAHIDGPQSAPPASAHDRRGRVSQPATELRLSEPPPTLAELRQRAQQSASRRLRGQALRTLVRASVLVIGDLTVLGTVWYLYGLAREEGAFLPALAPIQGLERTHLAMSVLVGLLAVGAYRGGDRWRSAGIVLRGTALGTGLALWGDLWEVAFAATTLRWLLATVVLGFVLAAVRSLVSRAVTWWRSEVRDGEPVLLVGPSEDLAHAMESRLFKAPSPFRLRSTLGADAQVLSGAFSASVLRTLVREKPSTIVVGGYLSRDHWVRLVEVADLSGCRLLSMGRNAGGTLTSVTQTGYNGVPVVEITAPHLRYHELAIKRIFDVVVSTVTLVALSPLLAAIAIAVKSSSKGPVLFSQERVGQAGHAFRILKFRSMWANSEKLLSGLVGRSVYEDGRLFKVIDDPRVTPLGKFLRRTSLDELPQLLNVLRGDMSLVGPRPPVPREVVLYKAHHYCRFDVKPGITGPWQISGRNAITDFEEVLLLEQEYIHRWSLSRDLKILLETVPVVMRGTGAS